jgi:mRNA-degrading endonuclease RelE of RelBE toxin-antitoxin system
VSYQVEFTPLARRQIRELSREIQSRILPRIDREGGPQA